MADRQKTAYQPTTAEREDFDYFWQHLRRNPRYRELAKSYQMVKDRMVDPQTVKCQVIGSWQKQPTLHEQYEALSNIRGKLQKRTQRCLGLLEPLDPRIEESAESLRLVLIAEPNYFQSPHWHAVVAKQKNPPAIWNTQGAPGCAWTNNVTQRLQLLSNALDGLENHHYPEMDEHWAKAKRITVEEYQAVGEIMRENTRKELRELLERHRQMDFVLDTSLPWKTVADALKAELSRVKALRKRVGLVDTPRARKRLWALQLQVYDAYNSHWRKNRDRFRSLLRVYRENLGFREALELLGVNLTPEEIALAIRLGNGGMKVKKVFKYADSFLRHLEAASYLEARAPHAEGVFFDEESRPTAVIDFAHQEVLTALDGVEPEVEPARHRFGDADMRILQSWRPCFSFPKPQLLADIARMKGDTRRQWCMEASCRIDLFCSNDPPT